MALTWNTIIIGFFVAFVAFGFMMQKEKITVTLISTYIALAITTIWGQSIYNILSGNQVLFNQIWFRGNVNPFVVKTIIFIGFIVLLSFKSKVISGKTSRMASPLITIAYSLMTAALILSSLLSFMPPSQRMEIIRGSHIATIVYNLKTWWVLLPALMMIFVSATSGSSEATATSAAKTTRKEIRRRKIRRYY